MQQEREDTTDDLFADFCQDLLSMMLPSGELP